MSLFFFFFKKGVNIFSGVFRDATLQQNLVLMNRSSSPFPRDNPKSKTTYRNKWRKSMDCG